MITRNKGQSSVCESACRAAEKMLGARIGITHNFIKNKPDLIYQSILLPEQEPPHHAKLWNEVERVEKRKDAQFYQARLEKHQQIAQCNGKRLLKDPGIAFKALPQGQFRFSDQDLVRFVRRHSLTDVQFHAVYEAVKNYGPLFQSNLRKVGKRCNAMIFREVYCSRQY